MFYERELLEMFGVAVTGLADTSHLFLPDGWPDGVYPLLKDVDAQAAAERASASEPPEMGRQGDKFYRPHRPAASCPEGTRAISSSGWTASWFTSVKVRLGYVHRGIERATQERNYVQNLYLVERVCGICSHSHANAYSLAVEKLAGVQVTAAGPGDPRDGCLPGTNPQPLALAGRGGARGRLRDALHV